MFARFGRRSGAQQRDDQRALYRMRGTAFVPLHKVDLASHICHGKFGEVCTGRCAATTRSTGSNIETPSASAEVDLPAPLHPDERLQAQRDVGEVAWTNVAGESHRSGGSHATVTEGDRPWPLFCRGFP
jgi:hypothetical protein